MGVNKTSITAALGIVFGILVSLGVITPDVAEAATSQADVAVDQIMDLVERAFGLLAILMSLLHLFQRRATEKLQNRMDSSTLLAAPPGTLPREIQS